MELLGLQGLQLDKTARRPLVACSLKEDTVSRMRLYHKRLQNTGLQLAALETRRHYLMRFALASKPPRQGLLQLGWGTSAAVLRDRFQTAALAKWRNCWRKSLRTHYSPSYG